MLLFPSSFMVACATAQLESELQLTFGFDRGGVREFPVQMTLAFRGRSCLLRYRQQIALAQAQSISSVGLHP